ncbi:hypothetical protein GW17_00049570 [Ensete ventricosum]|nr:hypothetical protein GW17_00049570 [Ensete ventricosum]
MGREVGEQVVPPVFFHRHRALPGPFHESLLPSKKRDFPWKNNPSFPHNQQHERQLQRLMGASLPNHGGNWNPDMWDWDSVRFTAKPLADASNVLCLGSQPSSAAAATVDQKKKRPDGSKDLALGRSLGEDDENLALKLGGEAYSVDQPAARPNKRVRSGSPVSGGNCPICQVDDCKADLSSAKDYHRRHKVCEVHSKTAKALVGKQMQRFCQQCSRRRLAGHNRRRRKTQPLDASSRPSLPRNQENGTNWNLDVVNLLVTLASPADNESPAELGSASKYLSSESSNPLDERSPSSSPPVTKKLFPLHSTMELVKYAQVSECQEDNATVELSTSHGGSVPLDLFKESEMRVENGAVQSVLHQTRYKSSSLDHSPASSNSDAQLEDDLLQRVTSLVQHSGTDFWRNGRFLVRTNKQLVSHKDGKIRLSKTWRAWSAPELTSVSPIAVVSGQETSFFLKGRNLTVPGTKIHCTYMGKYVSKEVLCSAYPGTIYDDSCIERFEFPGGYPESFEIDLLSRAVKRKSKTMVDLFLHYYVSHGKDETKLYLFPPNMAGLGGVTPLHMAASMQDSEDMVDALTNDPQEVKLVLTFYNLQVQWHTQHCN